MLLNFQKLNLKAHYCVNERQPLYLVHGHLNPIPTLASCYCNIHAKYDLGFRPPSLSFHIQSHDINPSQIVTSLSPGDMITISVC
jgi:hypothetical protein